MQEHLLKAAKCRLFACTDSNSNNPVLARLDLKPIVIPELEMLLATDLVDPYPYIRTTQQGLNDPLMKLHTSGTSSVTGNAKLITYSLGTTCAAQVQELVPDLNGYKNLVAKDAELTRVYTASRISHAGGVFLALRLMYQGVAIVPGGANPLSLDDFEYVLNGAGIDAVFGPPILFEAMAKRPDLVRQLSKLKQVIFGGGKLAKAAGDEITKHTELYSRYGSTENATPSAHATDPEDWQYCHFSPEYSCFSFRRHPPDDPNSNLFEAVMVRHPDPAVRRGQPVFWSFPDRTEWSMDDLFEPHPTKPNHWKYICRRDDMIIVGNGTNVMPTFFEQEVLQRDPRVKKAVMYGNGQAHLAVLIELTTPVDGAAEMEHMKQELWPLVESCNQKMSRGTQVAKHAIVIAAKDRPLPRGGKGDVQRRRAEAMYVKELAMAFKDK